MSIFYLFFISSTGWASEAEKLHVEVTGVKDEVLKNIEVFLSIANAAKEQKVGLLEKLNVGEEAKQPDLSERTIRRLHRLAPKEIRQAMQAFGYYEPKVKAKLKKTDGIWQAAYNIDRGPATNLDHVDIEVNGDGGSEPSVQKILTSLELVSGQRVDHGKYRKTKSQLYDILYNAGFIDARFTRSEINVYPLQHKADISIILESGPQFKYGPVTVEQDILRPEFINQLAKFKQGERFDTNKLIDFQLALLDSNYFSHVEVLANRENSIGTEIPIVVKTEPNKPRRYTSGLGFGTDTGPRVTAGVELRRINRRGHKMRTDLRASFIEQTISAQYLVPIKNILTDNLAFTASASRETVGDIETEKFQLGTSLDENWLGFRRRLYLDLERENFDLGDGTQTATLLTPGFQLSWKNVDDTLFPGKGYSAALDLHGGLESPLTETTFLHTSVNVRTVLSLNRHSRLLLRGELGAIQAATFSDLPPSQRFFAGGDQSVRGYAYQGLGPKNSDGDVIGGQYLAVASVEADYLFYGNFGAAMFYDVGNAGDDLPLNLNKGVGIGLRYRSPVGMISLDLAHPLDDPENDFRIHISIGGGL